MYIDIGIHNQNPFIKADIPTEESVSFNEMLSKRPTLDELCEQLVSNSPEWYLFGVFFQLEKNQLEAIRRLQKSFAYKMLKIFKVLLHVNPNTTRKQVIDGLYCMHYIKLAKDYMNSLINIYDITGKKINIYVLLVLCSYCVHLVCEAQNICALILFI